MVIELYIIGQINRALVGVTFYKASKNAYIKKTYGVDARFAIMVSKNTKSEITQVLKLP